ncbi:MAG: NB-ARC domain-containing protein, partial [Candidatus Lernaella stagnicola]|nr:NB-ARC domain-containing protein [Candidatus Lernaella stagnicola]
MTDPRLLDVDRLYEMVAEAIDAVLHGADETIRRTLVESLSAQIDVVAAAADLATFGLAGRALDAARKLVDLLPRNRVATEQDLINIGLYDLSRILRHSLAELRKDGEKNQSRIEKLEKALKRVDNLIWQNVADVPEPEGYIERDGKLEEIASVLENGAAVGITGVSLEGMGGVGKSYLAQEFALSCEDKYENVVFLRLDELFKPAAALTALIIALDGKPPEVEAKAGRQVWELALRNHAQALLAASSGLLVLDNVDKYAQIEALLPQKGSGWQTIITTRDRALFAGAVHPPEMVEVAAFTVAETERFFADRLGKLFEAHRDKLLAIATDKVECLPLALEVLVGHIKVRGPIDGFDNAIDDLTSRLEESLSAALRPAGTGDTSGVSERDARNRRIVDAVLYLSLKDFENNAIARNLLRAVREFHPQSGGRCDHVIAVSGNDENEAWPMLDRLIFQRVVIQERRGELRRVRLHTLMREVIGKADAEYDEKKYARRFWLTMLGLLFEMDEDTGRNADVAMKKAQMEAENLRKTALRIEAGGWVTVEQGATQSAPGRFAAGFSQWANLTWLPAERRGFLVAGKRDADAVRDALAQANCLWSLGDLARREDDLSGARASYDSALPLFRAIGHRLGEANCLRSLGDLGLRE